MSIRGIDVVCLMIQLSIIMCFRAYEFRKQNKFRWENIFIEDIYNRKRIKIETENAIIL